MKSLFLVTLSLLSLLFSKVNAVDCGCPHHCNEEALKDHGGTIFACEQRIEFMMKRYDLPEANACAAASKDPTLDEESNSKRPCAYEKCNPVKCGSHLNINPDPVVPITCGCESCNNETLAATLPGQKFSCETRIHHFMHYWHLNEWDACQAAAKESSCDFVSCDPTTCGSTLNLEPAFQEDNGRTREAGEMPGGFVFLLIVLIALPGLGVMYLHRQQQLRKNMATPTRGDGIFKDKKDEEDTNDLELSASYKDEPTSSPRRTSQNVPPANAFARSNFQDNPEDDEDAKEIA